MPEAPTNRLHALQAQDIKPVVAPVEVTLASDAPEAPDHLDGGVAVVPRPIPAVDRQGLRGAGARPAVSASPAYIAPPPPRGARRWMAAASR